MKGLDVFHNRTNRFCIIKLHYTADPEKRGKKWKEAARSGMTKAAWEQEYELNFEQRRGKAVFGNEFIPSTHVSTLVFNKHLIVHRGWDFGYHHPCCLWTQVDTDDKWLWVAELMGSDEDIGKFAERVKKLSPKGLKYKDYCDPAGNQSSDKKERTSVEVLNALGIWPRFRKTNPEDRARIMRSKLLLRKDLKPGLKINKSCRIAVEGMQGGYHYPEITVRQPAEKEMPFKDGFYDHLFDAAGYIAIFLFFYKNAKKKIFKTRRRSFNSFTGA